MILKDDQSNLETKSRILSDIVVKYIKIAVPGLFGTLLFAYAASTIGRSLAIMCALISLAIFIISITIIVIELTKDNSTSRSYR